MSKLVSKYLLGNILFSTGLDKSLVLCWYTSHALFSYFSHIISSSLLVYMPFFLIFLIMCKVEWSPQLIYVNDTLPQAFIPPKACFQKLWKFASPAFASHQPWIWIKMAWALSTDIDLNIEAFVYFRPASCKITQLTGVSNSKLEILPACIIGLHAAARYYFCSCHREASNYTNTIPGYSSTFR